MFARSASGAEEVAAEEADAGNLFKRRRQMPARVCEDMIVCACVRLACLSCGFTRNQLIRMGIPDGARPFLPPDQIPQSVHC